MSLEDICPIEALFRCRARAGTKVANHGALVVRQSVPVFVILAREAFRVVLAGYDGALLWSLGLMRQHVGFQILEESTAFWVGASATLSAVFFKPKAS